MKHIVIIGNGISGITTARHIRKLSDHKITVISGETEHFFSRTALMYVYMGHMKFEHTQPYEKGFWKKNRIELLQAWVSKVDPSAQQVICGDGTEINYDELVIATGSKPNLFGWPGQELEGVQGLYSKQDLDLLEQNAPNKNLCQRAVIVGGGLIGIELAEMLRTRDIPVTFLVREENFWDGVLPKADAQLINEHIKEHHIDLRLATGLKEILDDGKGRVKAVVTIQGETIACNLVGLTAGVTPNIGFLEGSGIATNKGVLVNRHLETNIPHIYAIGDCAEQHQAIGLRRPVEAVWYTGRMMGEVLAQTLCGNKMAYNPGHWFNSAKFLDVEYQTYGWVFSERRKEDHEAHFHWQHPTKKLAITVAYHKENETFLGINTFGIRMRHEVFDRWLNQQQTIDHVMAHLAQANFDPELYKRMEPEILQHYNKARGKNLSLLQTSNKTSLIS